MAKTKALISLAVTAKLICVFVFAYAKSQFSHDAAHITFKNLKSYTKVFYHGEEPPKHGMASSVDPDHTAPLHAV